LHIRKNIGDLHGSVKILFYNLYYIQAAYITHSKPDFIFIHKISFKHTPYYYFLSIIFLNIHSHVATIYQRYTVRRLSFFK